MFTLDQIVPWGRSFDEYCRMFGLSDEHLRLRILGCGRRQSGRTVCGCGAPSAARRGSFLRSGAVLAFSVSIHIDARQRIHLSAVREMCRVASEVRIFPLVALDGRPSALMAGVVSDVSGAGLRATIEPVAYKFQRGATQMLRIVS